ncbi:cyclohexanone monooxygenase [Mycena floridula]|nr:cyclohexanone monooxygenase [Mycena floridula]
MEQPTLTSDRQDIPAELDCLIVGAGFGGVYFINQLRKKGYKVKAFEAAKSFGGIWYWNTYPGARVDSEVPLYEFSDPEIWKDWEWTQRYPDAKEIQAYFAHVDKTLNISKDVFFDMPVVSAKFDKTADQWIVGLGSGKTVRARFLLLCTGIGAKAYVPEFAGLENFKGEWYHTSKYPVGVETAGKRVGVIGTGATGVQVIQELAQDPSTKLTVFQRTPNLALPMNQHRFGKGEIAKLKETYFPTVFRRRLQTACGFHFNWASKNYVDATPEERHLFWEELWDMGGFRFWIGSYPDVFSNKEANAAAYAFWRSKVVERINDPAVAEILAPQIAPHPFGTKRPSLEQKYFEVYNQPNVTLLDVKANPISEITEKGVKLANGDEHELDMLILATGYDAVTGGITQIDIEGTDGVSIKEKWSKGLGTYLGYMSANFPNVWFTYGPHGPTAFCNGPTCTEVQGGWILDCLEYMQKNKLTRIEPTLEAEKSWKALVDQVLPPLFHDAAKLSTTGAWYMGSNIPGKPVETLSFTGGLQLYAAKGKESADKGYEGFVFGQDGKLIEGPSV